MARGLTMHLAIASGLIACTPAHAWCEVDCVTVWKITQLKHEPMRRDVFGALNVRATAPTSAMGRKQQPSVRGTY